MKKIFLISDSPYATTGLGRMSKYFMYMLPEFEWYHWGVNHPTHNVSKRQITPTYSSQDFNGNFKIISPTSLNSQQDPTYAFEYLKPIIDEIKPDYLITCLDFDRVVTYAHDIKDSKMKLGFKWINYFPVDRPFVYKQETTLLAYPDINVVITKYGQKVYKKFDKRIKLEQIYHPIDHREFPLIDSKEIHQHRRKAFPGFGDGFLIGNVNRNFWRKDLYASINSFMEFYKKHNDSMIYFHSNITSSDGYDFKMFLQLIDAPRNKIQFMPDVVTEDYAIKQESLNKMYQSFDLFLTTSMGEGFGFTAMEALLTGTPVIAPDNTSFKELIQDFGYLVPTTQANMFYKCQTLPWHPVDHKKLIKKMEYVYNNMEEAKDKARRGRAWIKNNLSLKKIEKQWRKLIK